MNDKTYRAFLDLFMCSDPYPDTKENEAIVRDFLDDEARKRGHENWVVAYHEVPGGGDGE